MFRIAADGAEISLVTDLLRFPNGLAFSPDESLLYVSDSHSQAVWVFERLAEATFAPGELFADMNTRGAGAVADGMAIDRAGNLYVTANTVEGIAVLSPTGFLLGYIGLGDNPAVTPTSDHHLDMAQSIASDGFFTDTRRPANVTFGRKGSNSLFVAARSMSWELDLIGSAW